MKYSAYALLAGLLLASCQEDEDTNNYGLPTSLIKFSATEASSIEGSGLQQVRVSLDKPQEGSTLVNFSVNGNFTLANGAQFGDVRLITESPLLIPAGETEAFINFEILEDFDFESDPEVVTISLNSVLEGNAQLSTNANERIYQHNILENEYELSLEWDQATDSNIELVVELPNNELLVSNNSEGFEKVVIGNVDPNATYLVSVWYYQGQDPVNYQLTYHRSGSDELLLQEGKFKENEASQELSLTTGDGTHLYKLVRAGTDLVLINR